MEISGPGSGVMSKIWSLNFVASRGTSRKRRQKTKVVCSVWLCNCMQRDASVDCVKCHGSCISIIIARFTCRWMSWNITSIVLGAYDLFSSAPHLFFKVLILCWHTSYSTRRQGRILVHFKQPSAVPRVSIAVSFFYHSIIHLFKHSFFLSPEDQASKDASYQWVTSDFCYSTKLQRSISTWPTRHLKGRIRWNCAMSMTFIAAGDTECVDDASIGDLYDKRSQWRRCLSPSF